MKNVSKALLFLSVLLLTGCAAQVQSPEVTADDGILKAPLFRISVNDRNTAPSEYEEIDLSELDTDLYITRGGTYRLKGSMRGTVYVDSIDENVHLVLADAEIEGGDGPAILALSAGKLYITSEENTVNVLFDAGAYEDKADEPACLFADCDLTINGTGALTVTGLNKDAVRSQDVLRVLASNITVRAKQDGLRGNDGVFIKGKNIRIETEGNGIRTTKSGEDGRGSIEIREAELSVISGEYALQAAGDLRICDSSCYLKGILGNQSIAGNVSVEEGNLRNE